MKTTTQSDECELCSKEFALLGESRSFKYFKLPEFKGIIFAHRAHTNKIGFDEWRELTFLLREKYGDNVLINISPNICNNHFHLQLMLPEVTQGTCILCGKKIVGPGNNPQPLVQEGVCCDSCNYIKVIPARFGRLK